MCPGYQKGLTFSVCRLTALHCISCASLQGCSGKDCPLASYVDILVLASLALFAVTFVLVIIRVVLRLPRPVARGEYGASRTINGDNDNTHRTAIWFPLAGSF